MTKVGKYRHFSSNVMTQYNVISYMSYVYLKVGTTLFYRLALCNLVLGLTHFI